MVAPVIEFLPLRSAPPSGTSTTMDVVVRIVAPRQEAAGDRPPLNLALVLDHSGSMEGQRLAFAKEAARYALEQLHPNDRVSLVIFDDEVEALVPSTLATDKARLLAKLDSVTADGSTALHAGWVEGSLQVSRHLQQKHLNRVILLSDGQANQGKTHPAAIAQDVASLSRQGVSTSTLGVGDDFNEDLLEAMARSGDGDYHYIESPLQLPSLFAAELQGLMGTLGRKVSLGLEVPEGVRVLDVLNDFDRNSFGRAQLPNLVYGRTLDVVVRLLVSAEAAVAPLLSARLAWDDAKGGERQTVRASLEMPRVSDAEYAKLPDRPEVQEIAALLLGARARRLAMRQIDQGDYVAASVTFVTAQEAIAALPSSPATCQELVDLEQLRSDLISGQTAKARKKSGSQSYDRQRSKGKLQS